MRQIQTLLRAGSSPATATIAPIGIAARISRITATKRKIWSKQCTQHWQLAKSCSESGITDTKMDDLGEDVSEVGMMTGDDLCVAVIVHMRCWSSSKTLAVAGWS